MCCLWHTLLLSKWNKIFTWLSVESIIHNNQSEYYNAINLSNNAGESTVFIEFMLYVIKEALIEAASTITAKPKLNNHSDNIKKYLQEYDYIMNADVQKMFNVSSATANRILSKLADEGIIERIRIGCHWGYKKI